MSNMALIPTSAQLRLYRIRVQPFGFVLEVRAKSRKDAYRLFREFYCAA